MESDRLSLITKWKKNTEYPFLAVLVGVASLLLFLNLDNQILWQDEAQTATIAKTILHYGIPKGYDGKNFFSQEYGADYGERYIWKWQTWLSFYLTAFSFVVNGTTTFAARLPFALFGLATVFLTFHAARLLFRSNRIGFIAVVFLLLCVPFLLLSRQCRYYAPAMFFSLLGLLSYSNLLTGRRLSHVMFVIASALLFHTQHLYYFTLLAAVCFHAVLFERQRIRALAIPALISLLINLPWVIWFAGMNYQERYGEHLLNVGQVISFGHQYLFQIGTYIFPPTLLLVPLFIHELERAKSTLRSSAGEGWKQIAWLLLIAVVSLVGLWYLFRIYSLLAVATCIICLAVGYIVRSENWKNVSLLVLFVAANITALVLAIPFPFFRYLGPLIPVFALLAAFIIDQAFRFYPVLGLVTILALPGNRLVGEYIYEITHDYEGPMEGIVRYLQDHGAPDDTVLITFEDLPLKFYTPMKVVGGLTGEDVSPYAAPQWIILRKYPVGLQDSIIRQHVWSNVDFKRYKEVALPYPDIPFQNRESPSYHRFRTVQDEDSVRIFQLIP